MEQQLLEEQYVEKQLLIEVEGLSKTQSAASSRCVLFISSHLVFTYISRVYECALIVRSQVVNPQHNAIMVKEEEWAWQHLKELKNILSTLSPCWWRKDFKRYVDKFINKHLYKKEFIVLMLCVSKVDEEEEHKSLHGLQCLVVGAIQEWELVQQPDHAALCAKLDGALVWQGRGYVSPIAHAISLHQPSFQG